MLKCKIPVHLFGEMLYMCLRCEVMVHMYTQVPSLSCLGLIRRPLPKCSLAEEDPSMARVPSITSCVLAVWFSKNFVERNLEENICHILVMTEILLWSWAPLYLWTSWCVADEQLVPAPARKKRSLPRRNRKRRIKSRYLVCWPASFLLIPSPQDGQGDRFSFVCRDVRGSEMTTDKRLLPS